MATTIENVTDRQINRLATEAAQAGDDEMYRIAVRANNGDDDARAECVRVIREAEMTRALARYYRVCARVG